MIKKNELEKLVYLRQYEVLRKEHIAIRLHATIIDGKGEIREEISSILQKAIPGSTSTPEQIILDKLENTRNTNQIFMELHYIFDSENYPVGTSSRLIGFLREEHKIDRIITKLKRYFKKSNENPIEKDGNGILVYISTEKWPLFQIVGKSDYARDYFKLFTYSENDFVIVTQNNNVISIASKNYNSAKFFTAGNGVLIPKPETVHVPHHDPL